MDNFRLQALIKKQNRLKNGWGNWKLEVDNLVLVYQFENIEYTINLQSCNTSAQILDWIYQVYAKSWAEVEDVYDLLRAFDDIIKIQQYICPFGRDRAKEDKFKIEQHINAFIVPFLEQNYKEG